MLRLTLRLLIGCGLLLGIIAAIQILEYLVEDSKSLSPSDTVIENLWNNPTPLPNFLISISTTFPDPVCETFNFCVSISQAELFEPGDEGDTYDSIQDTLTLDVDGELFFTDRVYFLAIAIARYDENGNYVRVGHKSERIKD